VAARVRAGDTAAVRVWDEAVDALADALTTVGTLFDPEVIVLGGGLSGAGPLLSAPLREGLAKRAHSRTGPQLRHALLGDEAGCVGAALFALDLIHSS
jgi:glucokinase